MVLQIPASCLADALTYRCGDSMVALKERQFPV
ncbi:hypothetical protein BCM14_1800 [Jezberella montanilacus]|uniref:Uncharacterized protein n=1 Tax=Jezberella montanilacus TaxID=323426 RepID=A0A2T0XGK6_9BURK|nr:hypothetical protein BCM14_1800 [Jezberella montanilacus]